MSSASRGRHPWGDHEGAPIEGRNNGLIRKVTEGNQIKHIPVRREAETIAICASAFFGGMRLVAIMGNTGLLTCIGEMATLA
jgi:sulfopyruvate decarboxylase TPP-binding subunit